MSRRSPILFVCALLRRCLCLSRRAFACLRGMAFGIRGRMWKRFQRLRLCDLGWNSRVGFNGRYSTGHRHIHCGVSWFIGGSPMCVIVCVVWVRAGAIFSIICVYVTPLQVGFFIFLMRDEPSAGNVIPILFSKQFGAPNLEVH